ncbi:uncharacterized protein [Chlorocebus sabaeus]|uniref:uncharacterized protein isoform X2 n=1 Tax=Chlorocebus sabaeus TaxID=60711 RepID=UPI00045DB9D6
MSLRKMKVVVSRTGAAAVPGEGRRMRRRPAWSAGPGAPAQGEVAAHPGPPGSPEDGRQRNKKMDSLAAGELNASHQPWVPEFEAHWRKTHQELSAPCCAHPSSSLTDCAPDPGAWCMHKLGTWSTVLTTMPGRVLEGKPSSSSEGVPFSCVGVCVGLLWPFSHAQKEQKQLLHTAVEPNTAAIHADKSQARSTGL